MVSYSSPKAWWSLSHVKVHDISVKLVQHFTNADTFHVVVVASKPHEQSTMFQVSCAYINIAQGRE
jgi:hypothetical protein